MISTKFLLTALLSPPFLQTLAQDPAIECPKTPDPLPKASTFPSITTLPDPFVYLDGTTRVKTPEEWYACRQPEIKKLLQEYQFGYYPDHSLETVTATKNGNNLEITVAVGDKKGTFKGSVTLPSGASKENPAPVVIAIGGVSTGEYTKNGVAVATFDYGSVAPDSNSKTGAFWSLYNGKDIGVLTAWAWGVHRVLDALILTAPEIDSTKVGVTGCSRLGKAALAAGLFDERITLTMPMSSGIQGLGPFRYTGLSGQGENLENSKSGAGWWTNSGMGTFVNQATKLPYDSHTIAAAIAPRAIIMEQGQSDPYVNSKGTAQVVFPATKLVFDWLGVGGNVALALRTGGHCDMSGDANVMPYVVQILKGGEPTRDYSTLTPWTAMPETYPWSKDIPPKP